MQYLSLGAGYDTFPYRQPAWAGTLRIFEVDQSPTQQEKRAKLHAAGIPIPPNVEFVPVDFEVTSLSDGLHASSFDFSQPTFISWLGVMVYLSQAAAAAVFRFRGPASAFQRDRLYFFQPHAHTNNRQISSIQASRIGLSNSANLSKTTLRRMISYNAFSP